MTIKVNETREWDIEARTVDGTEIIVKASAAADEKHAVRVHVAKDDDAVAFLMTADEFSSWSAAVLGQMRKEGWSPKR